MALRRPHRWILVISSLAAALSVVGFGAVRGSTGGSDDATVHEATMGVYRGPGPWGAARIATYERWLGRRVDHVLDFLDVDTWANQEWPDWQARAWRRAGRTVVLGGVGAFPVGGSWAAAAAGEYDEHWRRTGVRLVATGQAHAILRGAHEFNGSWFHYGVHDAEVDAFVVAWQRWVAIMREVPGQHFRFAWNPTIGTERLRHPDDAYPGDEWVDLVALDVYDGWYPRGWVPGRDAPPDEEEQDRVWRRILDGERGLRWWRDFARAHGKPLSLPEWGLRTWTEADGSVHGGGDDPRFVERMHELITDPAWGIVDHAFWEHAGHGISDADDGRQVAVPRSRAVFVALDWGSGPPAP